MKFRIFFITTIFSITSIITYCQTTKEATVSKNKIDKFLRVDKITGIKIYNANLHKSNLISAKSLDVVKSILKKSVVHKDMLPLKPGHIYIQFINLDYSNYNVYAYSDYIIFDPSIESSTQKDKKKLYPFCIELKKEINWDTLK